MALLRFLTLVLLAVWIGGLVALGFAAPLLFDVLQAQDPAGRELAGATFGAILGHFQTVAWGCGGLLLAILGARAALGPRPRRLSLRVWTVTAMLAISLATSFAIIPRIDRLRAEAHGPIAALAPADPIRVAFGQLHGLSNGLMLLTVAAGLVVLWLESRDFS